jgi:hypothetical protein
MNWHKWNGALSWNPFRVNCRRKWRGTPWHVKLIFVVRPQGFFQISVFHGKFLRFLTNNLWGVQYGCALVWSMPVYASDSRPNTEVQKTWSARPQIGYSQSVLIMCTQCPMYAQGISSMVVPIGRSPSDKFPIPFMIYSTSLWHLWHCLCH